MMRAGSRFLIGLLTFALCSASGLAAQVFRVATYNLENYLAAPAGTRPAKPASAKTKIRQSIRELKADVLALQEVGGTNALLELRASLKADGVDYPHWEFVHGFDTNIHVAVLSKFPFAARRPHTNESFLLKGRRFFVSRGFAEVDVQLNPRYTFTLISTHLKSRREVATASETELREQEARLLREAIDARLAASTNLNLVVLGDFNDTHDSLTIKTVLGKGATALLDTRPAERNGDSFRQTDKRWPRRTVTWTYHYGVKDAYERIDYLLLSRGMAKEWDPKGTFVLSLPNWGVGSDHRPLVASFWAEDR
ncbi:MAG: endonuclease/exonuclease/phosphatase family protein [Verrucomicrobia bacterium]|nr:endonuclease/exonuclease/phosphatase family protein [Verrucomicrobiota bacterium]